MRASAAPGTGAQAAGSTAGVLALPGAALAYEVTGDGPAVVLVHGFGLDMRMWDPQAAHLAARLPRDRATTAADSAPPGRSMPAVLTPMPSDLLALLDHLGIAEAVLVGLSFGGRVVLQAALAAPARVRGLVLLDAVLDGVPWDPGSAAALDEAARQAKARGRWPAGPPGWPTRCSPLPGSGQRWPARWPRWSPAIRGSTGPARTRTEPPGRGPSTPWKSWPCRPW